ncbi:uncharacterized protein LOC129593206 [Paramacrobiotus metropolitanus]|uniref:uncharacterized protein LOC129593206 n=1 Tax=Paramacrobiotus metropolitanus TaxID=2943436 RepID=UPI0024461FF3|nr:uncharacterized protein LOC129593206 [Paramacrobiotus metropolitanus]
MRIKMISAYNLTNFPFFCLCIAAILMFFFTLITFRGNSLNNSIPDAEPPRKVNPKILLPDEIFPDNTDDEIITASGNRFPVHLVRYYPREPEKPANNLCWVECLALMSIFLYIKADHVYVHTNYPDFWPFDSCGHMMVNWTSIQLVNSRRRFTVNGKRLNPSEFYMAHEADLAKFIALYKYGGIALDFDVFILPNITKLLSRLDSYDCVASREPDKLNSGFLACHPGSPFIGDILRRYVSDYKPEQWVYNSGEVPWQIYSTSSIYQRTVFVDDQINDHPDHAHREQMWEERGIVNWRDKPAYHSLFHNCSFGERAMIEGTSSLTDLMRAVFDAGRTSSVLMTN